MNYVVIKLKKIKDIYIYYQNISNIHFISPEYIYDIQNKK